MFYILNTEQVSLIGTELLLGLLGWRARELPFSSAPPPPCCYYKLLLSQPNQPWFTAATACLTWLWPAQVGLLTCKGNKIIFMHDQREEGPVDLSGVGRQSIASSSLLNVPSSLLRQALPAADGRGDEKVAEKLKNQGVWLLLYMGMDVFLDANGSASIWCTQRLFIHWFNGHSELFVDALCYIRPSVETVLYNNGGIGKGAFLKFSLAFSKCKPFFVLQVRKKACRRSRRVSSSYCFFHNFYIWSHREWTWNSKHQYTKI